MADNFTSGLPLPDPIRKYNTSSGTSRLMYPSDLKTTGADIPYMTITIFDYREFFEVIDDKHNESSTIKDRVNKNRSFDGITPRAPAKEDIKATVILPIPQNIQAVQGNDWDLNNNAIIQSIQQFLASDKTLKDLGRGVIGVAAGTGIPDAAKSFTGAVVNPKKQALYVAPQVRGFTFDFIFTPYDQKEANTIDNIIKTLTKFSLPEVASDGAFFKFPCEFLVKFYNVKGFPTLDSCICQAVATNWTPNQLQLLRDGHSIQTTLSITLLETTLRTREHPGI